MVKNTTNLVKSKLEIHMTVHNCQIFMHDGAPCHPTSLSALQLAIKEVWVKEISSNYCCKLIESMPHRLQEVIKNKGGHTKY